MFVHPVLLLLSLLLLVGLDCTPPAVWECVYSDCGAGIACDHVCTAAAPLPP
jgi:hypothetical protein